MERIRANDENRKCLSLICGRASISQEGGLIYDPKAEEIASCLDADTDKLHMSRYLALFLGVRARVLDEVADRFIVEHPGCIVLHLGCGLDSRFLRIPHKPKTWYDLDFPEVIELRRRFYAEDESYHMIGSDVADVSWMEDVERSDATLVLAEGLTMFLTADENLRLIAAFAERFPYVEYAFDVYTDRAILYVSDPKQPPKRGKTILWGLSKPQMLENIPGVQYLRAYHFNRSSYLRRFSLMTQLVYRILYGKESTNRYYRIYHYRIGRPETGRENESERNLW